jgi:hypothetical protein
MNVDSARQRNVTPQWMRGPGQRQIVVPTRYKQYCTAGARKPLYNAAHTRIQYNSDAPTVSMVGTVLYSMCTATTYHAARTVHAYDTVVKHRQ